MPLPRKEPPMSATLARVRVKKTKTYTKFVYFVGKLNIFILRGHFSFDFHPSCLTCFQFVPETHMVNLGRNSQDRWNNMVLLMYL